MGQDHRCWNRSFYPELKRFFDVLLCILYLYRTITFLFNLAILSSSIFGSLESPPLPPGLGALKWLWVWEGKKIALESTNLNSYFLFSDLYQFSHFWTCLVFFGQIERTTVQIMCKCLRFPRKQTGLISFRPWDYEKHFKNSLF